MAPKKEMLPGAVEAGLLDRCVSPNPSETLEDSNGKISAAADQRHANSNSVDPGGHAVLGAQRRTGGVDMTDVHRRRETIYTMLGGYQAIFNAIGDAVTRNETSLGISVEVFVQAISSSLTALAAPEDRADAERWRAFWSSARFKMIGSANFDHSRYPEVSVKPNIHPKDWLHFGLEVWDRHPVAEGEAGWDQSVHGRNLLLTYVEHRRAQGYGGSLDRTARDERCAEIAFQAVPEYGTGNYSCGGTVAKRWQAAWDAACIALGGDPAEAR